jgi:exodeoxyribonuclease VII large subunit
MFATPPATDDAVLTVGELTRAIRDLLARAWPGLWVEGEVSRVTRHASGHLYFSLRDRDGRGEEATLAAVLWRRDAQVFGRLLREGERVQCHGRLDLYPPQGRHQLICDRVRPVGAGALLQALEETKRRLAAEGLFAPERKRPLPFLPRTVGVVTSPTGAALRDILKVLGGRFPVRVLLAPAAVQGASACPELIRGLRQLDARPDVDVIIIGRGGGSLEDLWCFNDEGLARAVAATRTPVVSAVGHEIDTVLTDLVADLRAATPSAAAEAVVPARPDLLRRVAVCRDRLARALARELERRTLRLDDLRNCLKSAAREDLARRRRRVAELQALLRRHHPGARLLAQGRRLAALRDRLARTLPLALARRRARLEHLAATLHALGPEAQLARGYAIVRRQPELAILTDPAAAPPGTELDILLHHGTLAATVREER